MTEMKEYFIDVPGYEGYYKISNFGNVLGVKRGKLLKPTATRHSSRSQMIICLTANGKKKSFVLSTLVYLAFYKRKPNGMIEFNDGDTGNCSIYNMQEVDATSVFMDTHCRKIKDTTTGIVFDSVTALAENLGVAQESVCAGISRDFPKYRRYEYV